MKKAGFDRHCAVLVVIASWMLSACSPNLDWRTVHPQHSPGLQALFPCKPTQLDRTLALPALPGPPVTVHLVSCKVGDATWALSYFDAQEIGRVPQALAADNRALRDNLDALGRMGGAPPSADAKSGVVASDQGPAIVPGMTPNGLSRHWRLVTLAPAGGQGPLEVHAWHFSHGLMVYQASLWRPLAAANAKDSTEAVETFIQGFKFSD